MLYNKKSTRMRRKEKIFFGIPIDSVFFHVLGMMLLFSLVILVLLIFLICGLFNENQRKRENENYQFALAKTEQVWQMIVDTLDNELEQLFDSENVINFFLAPDLNDYERDSDVCHYLHSLVNSNPYVEEAMVYVPKKSIMLNSSGQILREHLAEGVYKNIIDDVSFSGFQAEKEVEAKLFISQGTIYLVKKFLPTYSLGYILLQLDQDMIYDAVCGTENQVILAYNYKGELILGNEERNIVNYSIREWEESGSPEYMEFDNYIVYLHKTSDMLFVCIGEKNSFILGENELIAKLTQGLLIFSIVLCFFSGIITIRIYRPLKKILSLFEDNTTECLEDIKGNEYEIIEAFYTHALKKNAYFSRIITSIVPSLQEKLYQDLLQGGDEKQNYWKTIIKHVDLIPSEGDFFCMVSRIQLNNEIKVGIGEILWQKRITEMIQDEWKELCVYNDYFAYDGLQVYVFCFPLDHESHLKNKMLHFAKKVTEKTETSQCRVFFGVGEMNSSFWKLAESYRSAKRNLEYNIYLKTETDDAPEMVSYSNYVYGHYEKRLLDFEMMEMDQLDQEQLVNYNFEIYQMGENDRKKIYQYLSDKLLEKLVDMEAMTEEAYAVFTHFTQQMELEEGEDLVYLVSEMQYQLLHFLDSAKKDNGYKYIRQAKEYIERNYSNGEISLALVASEIGISAPYLSRLFHQRLNLTFLDYLNMYRIEKAKILLLSTSMSASDIGFKCGFNSATNFVRVFRKYAGLTPGKYRETKA